MIIMMETSAKNTCLSDKAICGHSLIKFGYFRLHLVHLTETAFAVNWPLQCKKTLNAEPIASVC